MYLYKIEYNAHYNDGVALVVASNPNEAANILSNQGRFNGYKYSIYNIEEEGTTDQSSPMIISEVFKDKEIVTETKIIEKPKYIIVEKPSEDNNTNEPGQDPTNPDDSEDKEGTFDETKLDINKLTKEQIDKLKLRINEGTGTLYVDTIGWIQKKRESKHNHNKGYTLLNRHAMEGTMHLFYYDGEQWIDLGIPKKYRYIETQSERIDWQKLLSYGEEIAKSKFIKEKNLKPEYTDSKYYLFVGINRYRKGGIPRNTRRFVCYYDLLKKYKDRDHIDENFIEQFKGTKDPLPPEKVEILAKLAARVHPNCYGLIHHNGGLFKYGRVSISSKHRRSDGSKLRRMRKGVKELYFFSIHHSKRGDIIIKPY